jgi:hypothetical protein
MRAGPFAGLALGLALGPGLVALVIGGCAKLIDKGTTKHEKDSERKLKEKAAKKKGEGWENVEVEHKEKGKEKVQ